MHAEVSFFANEGKTSFFWFKISHRIALAIYSYYYDRDFSWTAERNESRNAYQRLLSQLFEGYDSDAHPGGGASVKVWLAAKVVRIVSIVSIRRKLIIWMKNRGRDEPFFSSIFGRMRRITHYSLNGGWHRWGEHAHQYWRSCWALMSFLMHSELN